MEFQLTLPDAHPCRLIMHLWRQLSSRAPSEAGSPEGSEDEALTSITKPVKKLLCSVGLSRSSATSQGGGMLVRAGHLMLMGNGLVRMSGNRRPWMHCPFGS